MPRGHSCTPASAIAASHLDAESAHQCPAGVPNPQRRQLPAVLQRRLPVVPAAVSPRHRAHGHQLPEIDPAVLHDARMRSHSLSSGVRIRGQSASPERWPHALPHSSAYPDVHSVRTRSASLAAATRFGSHQPAQTHCRRRSIDRPETTSYCSATRRDQQQERPACKRWLPSIPVTAAVQMHSYLTNLLHRRRLSISLALGITPQQQQHQHQLIPSQHSGRRGYVDGTGSMITINRSPARYETLVHIASAEVISSGRSYRGRSASPVAMGGFRRGLEERRIGAPEPVFDGGTGGARRDSFGSQQSLGAALPVSGNR